LNEQPASPEPEFDPERLAAALRALETLARPINLFDALKNSSCPNT